jgi:uncharacterized protein YjiS (DUF1127 family)
MSATTNRSLINFQLGRPSITARVASLAKSARRTLQLWRSRVRERRAFPVLEERDLRDFGMSRWQVQRELAKPFWRG